MIGATLRGGPYDGCEFSFVERMPSSIAITVDVIDVDLDDPDVSAALRENAKVEPDMEREMVVRNAREKTAVYTLETDEEGTPFYQHAGWKLLGAASFPGGE